MNSLKQDIAELVVITSSFCTGGKQLVSAGELIQRLKDVEEKLNNDYENEDLLHLRLKLLCHLTFVLRTIGKIDEKCMIVNFMRTLLRACIIDDIELFIHLYNTIFYQIYSIENVNLLEELKLDSLEFAIELIKRSTDRVFYLLYNENFKAKFSMGVLIAVNISKEEKSFKLRTTALDFLLYAMQYHRRNDKVIQGMVGDLFMSYLPGVIGRLEDIIIRDETQQHLITVKAIICMGQLLCTVMQDLNDESNLTDEEQIKIWMKLSKEMQTGELKLFNVKRALQEKTRCKIWLQAAAQTIKPLILKMTVARKHSNPKVRLELTVQISRLLDNCLMTLKPSLNPIIDILISSSEDEDDEVREAAELAIARFESKCREKNGQVYLNLIEEHLNSLINKLPNLIYLQDDKAILTAIQSLCGDLKILKNGLRLGEFLSFSSNLTRFVRVLVISLRMALYPEISLQDYSVWDYEQESKIWTREWKRFKHFADEKIREKLTEICKILGAIADVETILDYLFDKFREDNGCRNELLFIINEILNGCSDVQDNVVEQFLTLYLDPDNIYLPLKVDDEECTNLHQSHSNIITVALIMEGIGKLSKAIGKRFEYCLLRSLYFVVEKMGSTYSIIRKSAVTAAVEISASTGHDGDISLLIQKNVDYLTYHITVKLRRDNPGVFDVVTVLIKNSPFNAVSNLEEIINNVLKKASEKFESPNTTSYLRLFLTFVRCVSMWLSKADHPKEEPVPALKSQVDLLLEYIEEREKEKLKKEQMDEEPVEEEEEEEDETGKDEEEEILQQDKKKNLPKHIKLTVLIAENALNYLPSNNFDKKLLVLEILIESILILADRENELLPLVHKIWSPLVTRFEQNLDPLLVNRSFTLLYKMARTSKDFIRRRTLKNVLPTLRGFLVKSAEKSRLKDSGTGYHFTQTFKLQKELLNKLAVLAIDLSLSGKELDLIIECSYGYLSSFQPLPLQENCIKLFKDLKDHDPYLVWYKLQTLETNPEFKKNVGVILDYIMSDGSNG